jgi:hypothetical protein
MMLVVQLILGNRTKTKNNNPSVRARPACPQIHKKREKENYNTKAQELFDDVSREVDDATT